MPELKSTVLVVEDHAGNLAAVTKLFGKLGWGVTSACDACSAFEVVGDLAHASAPLDLALVDLMIPDKSGADVIRSIRVSGIKSASGRPTFIIAYTGVDLTPDPDGPVALAFAAGADAIVAKPSSVEHILAIHAGREASDVPIPPHLSPRRNT